MGSSNWRVDLNASMISHNSGLIVRFEERLNGSWEGYMDKPVPPLLEKQALESKNSSKFMTDLMCEAGEVYLRALKRRH